MCVCGCMCHYSPHSIFSRCIHRLPVGWSKHVPGISNIILRFSKIVEILKQQKGGEQCTSSMTRSRQKHKQQEQQSKVEKTHLQHLQIACVCSNGNGNGNSNNNNGNDNRNYNKSFAYIKALKENKTRLCAYAQTLKHTHTDNQTV